MKRIDLGAVDIHFGSKSGKYPDGNQVIVNGTSMKVAFDTPLVSRKLTSELENIDLFILSHVHEDHTVALGSFPEIPVQVHKADLPAIQSWDGIYQHYGYPSDLRADLHHMLEAEFDFVPRPDATSYTEDTTWDLGSGVKISACHLPGHTAGHCALIVENEGAVFIGDIDLSGFGPYYGDATSSLPQFRQSLHRIKDIDADIWITSHHKGIIRGKAQFLQLLNTFTSKLDERTELILQYLNERPQSLEELTKKRVLYPAGYVSPFVDEVEQRTITMHLHELQAKAAISINDHNQYYIV